MVQLTIIIPCFNVENYVEKCVNSLINSNIEIILINDGSTDSTQQKCENLRKKFSNVNLINIQNSGVSHARNIGLKNANGKYIWFVDSDDYLESESINKILSNLQEFNPDVYCFGYNLVYPSKIRRSPNYSSGFEKEFIKDLMLGKYDVSMWNKIVKKSVLSNVEFNENIRINEDKLLCYEVFFKASSVYYDDHPYYNYLQKRDGNTKSVYFDERYFDVLIVLNLIEQLIVLDSRTEFMSYYYGDYCKSIIGLYHRAILQKDNAKNAGKIRGIIKENRKKMIENSNISKNRKLALIFILYFRDIYKVLYIAYYKRREKSE